MFNIFEFFSKLFNVNCSKETESKEPSMRYGKLYLPQSVIELEDFASFRNKCLPKWIEFYKSKGVEFEVSYIKNRGPEVVRTAVSKYEFHYGINLHLGTSVTDCSFCGEVATMPNDKTFISFVRFQELSGKYFGIREVDVTKGPQKLTEVFEREISEYGKGGKALSIYTPDEERFALESKYLKENGLVDDELGLSTTNYKADREFHNAEEGYKVLVPCGHGDQDYTTGHRFDSYNNKHQLNGIVSDTCEFLEDLGTANPVGDYLFVFGNTNYGWGDAELKKPNWLQKLFGAKEHIELSGSTLYVEYFLKNMKSLTLGEVSNGAIRNVDGNCKRIIDDQVYDKYDLVAGKSYNFADASFVLFGNPAFRF